MNYFLIGIGYVIFIIFALGSIHVIIKNNLVLRLYARFVLFLPIKNCRTSKKVSLILQDIMNSGSFKLVSQDGHTSIISNGSYSYSLWTNNKYYAYLSSGGSVGGRKDLWDDEMPDAYTMLQFRDWLGDQSLMKFKEHNK